MTRNNYKNYYKENNNDKENNFTDNKIIPLDDILTNMEQNHKENNKEEFLAIGVVANCYKLNLREKPNKRSNVLDVLDKDSEVLVLENKQNINFYKVKFNELIGYCMKEFIELK